MAEPIEENNKREKVSCSDCGDFFATRRQVESVLAKTKGKVSAKLCARCRKKELVKKLIKYYH